MNRRPSGERDELSGWQEERMIADFGLPVKRKGRGASKTIDRALLL